MQSNPHREGTTLTDIVTDSKGSAAIQEKNLDVSTSSSLKSSAQSMQLNSNQKDKLMFKVTRKYTEKIRITVVSLYESTPDPHLEYHFIFFILKNTGDLEHFMEKFLAETREQ